MSDESDVKYVDPTKLVANLEDVADIDTNQDFTRPLVEEGIYTASINYTQEDASKRWGAREPKSTDKEAGRRWFFTSLTAQIISGKDNGEKFKGRKIRDGYVSTMVMDNATKVSRICVALNNPIENTPKGKSHEGQVKHFNSLLTKGDAICNIQIAWEASFSVEIEDPEAPEGAKKQYHQFDKARITGTRSQSWPKDADGEPLRQFTKLLKYVDPDDGSESELEVNARVQEVITRYISVAS